MEVHPKEFCILIASHISYTHRIPYLIECLKSLVQQKVKIPIYLSISFASEQIKTNTLNLIHNEHDLLNCGFLFILVKNEKTPQMRHFYSILENLNYQYEWIMFCDDDDSYHEERTMRIIYYIEKSKQMIKPTHKLCGLYESPFDVIHEKQRHEYWSYCVHRDLIKEFYKTLEPYPEIIDNKCCDVLFAEYLRRTKETYLFYQLKQSFYKYRNTDNDTSVTGYIQNNKFKYSNVGTPPEENSESWQTYLDAWNEHVESNLSVYLHDIYLRTLVGMDFDNILKSEFLNNYVLIPFMKETIINRMLQLHMNVLNASNMVYHIKTDSWNALKN